jgi:hypothetical protein
MIFQHIDLGNVIVILFVLTIGSLYHYRIAKPIHRLHKMYPKRKKAA